MAIRNRARPTRAEVAMSPRPDPMSVFREQGTSSSRVGTRGSRGSSNGDDSNEISLAPPSTLRQANRFAIDRSISAPLGCRLITIPMGIGWAPSWPENSRPRQPDCRGLFECSLSLGPGPTTRRYSVDFRQAQTREERYRSVWVVRQGLHILRLEPGKEQSTLFQTSVAQGQSQDFTKLRDGHHFDLLTDFFGDVLEIPLVVLG